MFREWLGQELIVLCLFVQSAGDGHGISSCKYSETWEGQKPNRSMATLCHLTRLICDSGARCFLQWDLGQLVKTSALDDEALTLPLQLWVVNCDHHLKRRSYVYKELCGVPVCHSGLLKSVACCLGRFIPLHLALRTPQGFHRR